MELVTRIWDFRPGQLDWLLPAERRVRKEKAVNATAVVFVENPTEDERLVYGCECDAWVKTYGSSLRDSAQDILLRSLLLRRHSI